MKLLCDNKAAVVIDHDWVQHDQTKYIEIDRHFIKEKINIDIISIQHVRSEDQIADILIKDVGKKNAPIGKLAIRDMYAPTCRGVLRCKNMM